MSTVRYLNSNRDAYDDNKEDRDYQDKEEYEQYVKELDLMEREREEKYYEEYAEEFEEYIRVVEKIDDYTKNVETIDLRTLYDEIIELETEIRLKENRDNFENIRKALGIRNTEEYDEIYKELYEWYNDKCYQEIDNKKWRKIVYGLNKVYSETEEIKSYERLKEQTHKEESTKMYEKTWSLKNNLNT